MSKDIFCIRHGLALHNVLFWKIGSSVYNKYKDTPLLPEGYEQAKRCRRTWEKIDDIELILVSPLSRTLETMRTIFKHKTIPIIALDELMEYPHGDERCNKRKRISELELVYPNIDFSNIKYDDDVTYDSFKESISALKKRQEVVKKFIRNRTENNIAIVSHSSWIGQFLFNKIEDEENELQHCLPFQSKI